MLNIKAWLWRRKVAKTYKLLAEVNHSFDYEVATTFINEQIGDWDDLTAQQLASVAVLIVEDAKIKYNAQIEAVLNDASPAA